MKILIYLIFLLLTLFNFIPAYSYRILGVFQFKSRSHNMLLNAIVKGLTTKGHQVDVATFYPLKNPPPNYRVVINLKTNESNTNTWTFKTATTYSDDIVVNIATTYGNRLCEHLKDPDFQKIIKNPPQNPPYDAVIIEGLSSHCYVGLGFKFKVPVILASPLINLPWILEAIGQPHSSAFAANFFNDMRHPLTFFERVQNVISHHIALDTFRKCTDDYQNEIARKYIDPDMPPLRELEKNITLALMNTFHSLQGIRPLVPGFIEVGGAHIMEFYEEMSSELEKWMNESTSGVVLFTFGSMVVIESMPENILRVFYSAFKKLAPVRVLMKVADNDKLPPGLPNNVRTSSWFPQLAILEHKNTKVFLTHGGLMSTQEAIVLGVPMVGIPLFSDQQMNIDSYVRKNMAIKLSHKNLTELSIYEALNEVMNNPKFRKAVLFERERFLDRPISAMDTAVYWIEYVIRHGPEALKSPLAELPWWKADLVDVYAFLLFSIIFTIYLVYLIAKSLILRMLFMKTMRAGKLHKH